MWLAAVSVHNPRGYPTKTLKNQTKKALDKFAQRWHITRLPKNQKISISEEMPNTKSAKKRLRQDKVRTQHNRSIKSAVRTQVKKVLTALKDGDVEKAETEYKSAQKKLDKASAKHIMHPNAAGRRKSRLQKAIKAAKAAG